MSSSMKTVEEIEPDIRRMYSELGEDPSRLRSVRIIDVATYRVFRDDGAQTTILRRSIDDFYGEAPGKLRGEEEIKESLRRFKTD